MKIAEFDLEGKVLVVAEIGNNHEGNFEVARELVRRAAECGVGAVKFQTFKTEYFVSKSDVDRFNRLKSFELSYPQFEELSRQARSLGLLFISTPLDVASAEFLNRIVDAYKIASGDNNFYPLIESACKTGKPLIVSSGLSDLAQLTKTKRFVADQWRQREINQELAILHCVSSYPVPPEQANLAAIPFLARELGGVIGYSDHTIGIDACRIAVALGAQIIEKHFTLDKLYSDFRDHQLSADPPEMKRLVEQVRDVRSMLGKPEKEIQPCEAALQGLIRRSIVAAADFSAGHRLGSSDLIWLRPENGLPPGDEAQVVGRRLSRALAFGEPIRLNDLE